MLSLTRKADYALVALAELARRAPVRISARRISQSVRIPLPVLSNILHRLLHEGLVTSTRGAQGGYLLSRQPNQISLVAVFDAIDGPVKLTMCCPTETDLDECSCNLEPTCQIKGPVQRVHHSLRRFLGQVTLAHVAFDTVPVNLGLPNGTQHGGTRSAGVMEKQVVLPNAGGGVRE